MLKKAMLLAPISITVLLTACSCTIGIKEKDELLFVTPVPIPEASKGAPVIATNQKIKLAVFKRPKDIYEQKVTGYVLVDPWFYELLIQAYKEKHE